jgi:uncharacterized protein (DUF2237 family)
MAGDRNVYGEPLARCSTPSMPTTGFTRRGMCSTHDADRGTHHVCLRDVGASTFCKDTGQTNWCADKRDWCVCEWAFDRAVRHGRCDAFPVKCDATNALALQHYEAAGKTEAAQCIRHHCPRSE